LTTPCIALLADIHGNLAALEAVLADLAQVRPSRLVLMGDLVMNGPYPGETLARLMALDAPGVMGNTDDNVVADNDPVGSWTRRQLDPAALAYLAALPLAQRITPPGGLSPQDDLLIVHSTPRSYNDLLILALQIGTSFTEITPPAEAEAMLAGARANLMVYGHIHYVSEGQIGSQRVMSLGAVGFPFDNNPAAAYALARWTPEGWTIEHRRVPYDHEAVARALDNSTIPGAARFAARIRTAAWLPRSLHA
jgi:diadenosine tetraphosphatase ApaH/serine/threonine PP2A family protein phosphatase